MRSPLPRTLAVITTVTRLATPSIHVPSTAATTASDDRDRPPDNPGPPLAGYRPDHPRPFAGGLRVHDPGLYPGGQGQDWYAFGTGNAEIGDGTIQVPSPPDGEHWSFTGTAWDTIPGWITESVPGVEALWAPETHHANGTYHLYYATSTFGSNRSVVGLATNTTLDPEDPGHAWVDRGPVVEPFPSNDFNATDPAVTADTDLGPDFDLRMTIRELHWTDDGRPYVR